MSKKFIFGVLLFLVALVPVCGYAQSYSTSDLEGNWIGYDFTVAPSQVPPVFWLRGDASIDASGNFTSATYTAPTGDTISATSGSVALDANGVMSGNFTLETGDTVTVKHGKLDSGKTHAAFVSTTTDGSVDIGVFFKSGGTFAKQDLTGKWYAYTTIIDASTGGVFWAYGTFAVDNQGDMTGSFTTPDGTNTAITSGTLTLDNEGIIGGQFALDYPQTVPITHGKLDQSKTIGAFVSFDPTTFTMGYAWIVKEGGTFADQDLDDIWYSYSIGVKPPPDPAVYWIRGKYSLNSEGNLTGSYVAPTGQRIRAPSGSMSIDSNGVATGAFNLETGDTATLTNGKLDQGKTSGCAVSISSAGMLSMAIFIKADTIQPSFSGAATNAVLANMYNATAVAYGGYALGGDPQWYPLMQLYADTAYGFAEDAHLQAFAALDQSSTFWGTYAVQYAADDLNNRSQAVNYINLAVQSAIGGDQQTAAYYAGFGLALSGAADLYNGSVIWCSSMEQGASP